MMGFKILACGSNGNHQLGLNDDQDRDTLTICRFRGDNDIDVTEIEDRPQKIICGGNHSFILFESGKLYSCGDNNFGQCGLPAVDRHLRLFTEVPFVNGAKWTHASCGWEFSILVNANNEIYSCGLGLKGELGLGVGVSRSVDNATICPLKTIHLNTESGIKQTISSLNHTIIQLENNDLLGWGNGRKGQLGSPAVSVIWEPRKLDLAAKSYALGREFTVIGSNKLEFLGNDKFEIEKKLPRDFVSFKTMWSSIHILDKSLESYGNNSHGQLFPDESITIQSFEVGSEHGILLDEKNQVLCWGWGEHGNCGKHPENAVTFDRLNVIYKEDAKVVLIAAGCATSWVVVEI